jgi:S-DNA-T family DNA segregation ATPase FtsK/SpoIIIE
MASRNPAKGPSRRPSATKTPPRGSSRPSSSRGASRSAAVRGALDPHRGDLIGLVIIVIGALLALAVYLRVAGPLGGGIDTGLGALVGIGRYLLPPALVACGVALLVDGQSEHRWRLAVGVGLATLAVLGLLHVARGPSDIVITPSEVEDAGGWFGAVVGEPFRQLIGAAGAVVLLVAVVLAGVLIATRASLRRVAVGVGRGVRSGAGPAWRKAQRAVRDMSTLSSASTTAPPSTTTPARTALRTAVAAVAARSRLPTPPRSSAARRSSSRSTSGPARRRDSGSSLRRRTSTAATRWSWTAPGRRRAVGCSRSHWPAMAWRPSWSA